MGKRVSNSKGMSSKNKSIARTRLHVAMRRALKHERNILLNQDGTPPTPIVHPKRQDSFLSKAWKFLNKPLFVQHQGNR